MMGLVYNQTVISLERVPDEMEGGRDERVRAEMAADGIDNKKRIQ